MSFYTQNFFFFITYLYKNRAMKTLNKLTGLIIGLILFIPNLNAQTVVAQNNDLNSANLEKKAPIELKMKKGQSRDVTLYVFQNNSYYFELTTPKKVKNTNIVIINEQGDIVYDNAIASFCSSATIYPVKNERLTLKIITQPAKVLENNDSYDLRLQIYFVKSINSL